MMNNIKPDKDSMMALEALLKIRSDSVAEPSVESPVSSPPQEGMSAFSVPAPSVMNLAQHFMPMQVMSAPTPYTLSHSSQLSFLAPAAVNQGACVDSPNVTIAPSQISPPNANRVLCTPPLTNVDENSEESRLRQDKIDAALRSKPQRGRKRENLSVMERLELTRTRNREHAKSTRIRKKARYQELVDKEVMYDKLKNVADLQEARTDALMTFIDVRDQLLCSSLQAASNSDKHHETLDKIMHDRSTFTFDVQLPAAAGVSSENTDAMTRMDMLEDTIRAKTIKQFGKDVVSKLGYRLVGGRDAIAVNKSDVAMVELSVVLKHANQDASVMSAMIRWKFAPNSEKLTGMQWTTTIDTLAHIRIESSATASNKSGHQLLGSQTCYPSVVSLDHGALSTEVDKSAAADEGPGMDI